ncbi:sulfate reduction electron transfer complex DsrMKJOP subunit DsrO [Acidiferrobacter sp.]|jgi:molybdopterin-containing oxidoreductase family iron-sulfur binding subunit|uniref:sulfate reduction electron transfer complex DsrMKJOP subunit DsrO n=1 Tax=Acidiferrobacter sp. TaxID=1872107 RepID=UPI00262A8BA2|nr:4Fe-4S dicluster domain-containing protein [Acidiferrobacter sp.]
MNDKERDEPSRDGAEIEEGPDSVRRGLLKMAGAVAALTLAPGVTVFARDLVLKGQHKAKGPVRYGLLIDARACKTGCDACVRACQDYNGLSHDPGPDNAQWIRKVTITDEKTGFTRSFPMMCQHCAHGACVDVCPTGASFRRPDGIVLVDKHRCIGCRYCLMACPYKARSFVGRVVKDQRPWAPRGKGTAEGCTMCVERVEAGKLPACVAACQKAGHKAMMFGNLHDPKSAIAVRLSEVATTTIRADLGMAPGVHYRGI